jgi:hypothetical protein
MPISYLIGYSILFFSILFCQPAMYSRSRLRFLFVSFFLSLHYLLFHLLILRLYHSLIQSFLLIAPSFLLSLNFSFIHSFILPGIYDDLPYTGRLFSPPLDRGVTPIDPGSEGLKSGWLLSEQADALMKSPSAREFVEGEYMPILRLFREAMSCARHDFLNIFPDEALSSVPLHIHPTTLLTSSFPS